MQAIKLLKGWITGVGVMASLALAWSAHGAIISVTNTDDSGPGSLWAALLQANSNGETNRIEVTVQGTIAVSSPLPTITSDVVLAGPGSSRLRLSGGETTALLSVAPSGRFVLEQLTLADGRTADGGGALRNQGTAILHQCLLTNNVATNTGGALLNYGELVLDRCTIVSNRVIGLPGQSLVSTNTAETGFNAKGGALCSLQGSVHMTNCTFWGNTATGGRGGDNGLGAGGAGGAGLGGGVFFTSDTASTNWMVNCTVSANQVMGGEGGLNGSIFGPPGPDGWGTGGGVVVLTNTVNLFLLNSIVAGNQADHALPDGYGLGPVQSLGGNLVGVTNGLSGFTGSDLLNTDPALGALQANGGPLPTCALLSGSAALDAGQANGAPAFDARGVIRPQGSGIDIGAYELGNQQISFPDPGANLTYGDPPFLLHATATSELPVTFNVLDGPGFISATNGALVVFAGAGLITVVASQPGNDIYLPAPNVTNVLMVQKANLIVSADDGTRAYGETNPAFHGTFIGVVNDDPITARFESAATQYTPAGVYGPASPYAITPVLNDPEGRLANYTVFSTNGTLTITKAAQPLIVASANTSRPYGEVNPPFQGTMTGLLPEDVVGTSWVCSATPSSSVGDYPITPLLSDPDGRLGNYDIVTNLGFLTITPVPLTVLAADSSRPYGEANPTFSGSLTGLVNGDLITAYFQSAAIRSTPPGQYGPTSPYAIHPMFVDPFARLVNYTVLSTDGTLTITKAAQPLTVEMFKTNRLYGATNLLWPAKINGIVNGDPITAVWVSSATASSPVGNYPMTPAWNDPEGRLAGYNVITNSGTLNVTNAPLVVTAPDASRYYGVTNPVFSGPPPVGLQNGDPISVTYGSAATASTAPGVYGPGDPLSIRPVLSDPDNRLGNYLVTTNEGTLTILDLPTVTIVEPTNGSVYFTGMDVPLLAQVSGSPGPVEAVVFHFATNELTGTTTNGTDFTSTITNAAQGAYSLLASMTNGDGQTILSDPVSFAVMDIPWTAGLVDTNSLEVRQTGLYFQDLWMTNITPLPMPAVMVQASGLAPGVQIYNAVETTNGTNVLQFNSPTAPGQALRFRLEYYVPDGHVPTPDFLVQLTQPAPPLALTGTGVRIEFFGYPWGDGTALLQFQTVRDRSYYVQYSSDLSTWITVQPAVAGTDNWIEWLDNGPPKTPSRPAHEPSGLRFYRVVEIP